MAVDGCLADDFKRLMEMYDLFRGNWFKTFGNHDGFDTWFLGRLMDGIKNKEV